MIQERGLAAFVSATGSAGTIAAGDYLKKRHGTRIAAVEALECPTMLNNGYGEHNIQGIGDKHIPLIHNVMNTDVVIGVSDRVTDQLNLLFGSDAGRNYLRDRRKLDGELVASFADVGISGYANIVASIKLAKQLRPRRRTTSSLPSPPTADRSTTANGTTIGKSISAARSTRSMRAKFSVPA